MRPRSVRARLTLWYTGLLTLTMLLTTEEKLEVSTVN